MNLVVSTTIGWNMGDQVILAGVKRILREAWGSGVSYVYHDRNPEKLPTGGRESHAVIRSGWADALIVAGSPGWTIECAEVYRTALENDTPIYMIGIGTAVPQGELPDHINLDPIISEALARAKLIICRDEIARDVISAHAPCHLLPCPALANGLWDGVSVRREGRVALGEFYDGPWDTADGVAHSYHDLERSGGRAFYSSSVDDYLAVYAGAERVTSSRLHASALRAAFGLPVTNLWPSDDARCSATWSLIESGMKRGLDSLMQDYRDILERVL